PQDATESRAVTDPVHARTHLAREPGEPVVARRGWRGGPHREVQGRTPMMDDHRQSDRPVVPAKFPNNAERSAAEGMEGRGLAKGNPSQQNAPRTLGRDRSEEHTSELQSRFDLVCRLLLEKKKNPQENLTPTSASQ